MFENAIMWLIRNYHHKYTGQIDSRHKRSILKAPNILNNKADYKQKETASNPYGMTNKRQAMESDPLVMEFGPPTKIGPNSLD